MKAIAGIRQPVFLHLFFQECLKPLSNWNFLNLPCLLDAVRQADCLGSQAGRRAKRIELFEPA